MRFSSMKSIGSSSTHRVVERSWKGFSSLNLFGVVCVVWMLCVIALHVGVPVDRFVSSLPVLCPWKALTGMPCPGCGMTRALVAMAGGHIMAALRYHPFSALLLGGLVLSAVKVHVGMAQPATRWMTTAALAGLLLWWGWARVLPNV